MLTAEQKIDLITVIRDYRNALETADFDLIADTAEALDCTVSAMYLEELDGDLLALIEPTYTDECDFGAAIETLNRALEQLA